ncbi:exopolysaccharide Pel transporter PelG [Wenyingzhuangia sp. IMCC45533]
MSATTELYIKTREKVSATIGRPVSEYAVMSTLESFGIREIDVPKDYQFDSLYTLSLKMYKELTLGKVSKKEMTTVLDDVIALSDYTFVRIKTLSKYYMIGVSHMLPFLLQVVCVVLFSHSLWVNINFNPLQSTAVVLAVIFSLILTGGFIQMIGRVGSYYWSSKQKEKSFRAINHLIWVGIKYNLLFTLLLFVINFFVYLYPFSVLLILSIYSFLISILLLCYAAMYPINKRWVIAISVTIGTLLSVALKLYTSIHIYFTHWIGIATTILLVVGFYLFLFKDYLQKENLTITKTIRYEVLVYNTYVYFTYGVLLYIFIFLDRIIAWSANRDIVPPYIVYFEQNYEIGMDLAIMVFFIVAVVLEYSISLFSILLSSLSRKSNLSQIDLYRKKFYRMYRNNLVMLLLMASIALVLVYSFITASSWGFNAVFDEPLTDISFKVFKIASVGYVLLVWAMLNVLYMFRLNEAKKGVISILCGLVANFIVGVVCSRVLSYEYSAWGLLVGSLVFLICTLYYNKKVFAKIDYYASF